MCTKVLFKYSRCWDRHIDDVTAWITACTPSMPAVAVIFTGIETQLTQELVWYAIHANEKMTFMLSDGSEQWLQFCIESASIRRVLRAVRDHCFYVKGMHFNNLQRWFWLSLHQTRRLHKQCALVSTHTQATTDCQWGLIEHTIFAAEQSHAVLA